MKTSKRILASAGLLLLATPAWASHSTRAEREATRQLNLDAARQGQSGNQDSNQNNNPGPQIAATDASANMPAGSPPAAAPTARIESAAIEAPVK